MGQEEFNGRGSKFEIPRLLLEGGNGEIIALSQGYYDKVQHYALQHGLGPVAHEILNGWDKIPLPSTLFFYPGQSIDSILPAFEKMIKPGIARGGNRNDAHAYIDVIHTERDVFTSEGLEKAIRKIEESADNEITRIHCEDWGCVFDPQTHILIQQQSPSPIIGAAIRNPHTREIHIEYVDISVSIEDVGGTISYARVREDGTIKDHMSWQRISDQEILAVARVFQRIEELGLFDGKHSIQMEFGFRPLLYLQARYFRKFEPVKDKVHLPEIDSNIPRITSRYCYGITPKEGIEIPLHVMGIESFNSGPRPDKQQYIRKYMEEMFNILTGLRENKQGHAYYERKAEEIYNSFPNKWESIDISSPWGFVLSEKFSEMEKPSNRVRLGNLSFYSSPTRMHQQMVHHYNYRFLKRANFVMINGRLSGGQEEESNLYASGLLQIWKPLEEFKESKVFADGKKIMVVPAKYL